MKYAGWSIYRLLGKESAGREPLRQTLPFLYIGGTVLLIYTVGRL
jgi:hypothetical protein